MRLIIAPSTQFYRDYKKAKKRGLDIRKLEKVVKDLAEGKQLADHYRDHQLTGQWHDFRECHIQPDWLLIYQIRHQTLVLALQRTGSHSDLFGK
jgi:mRNA interferase YafQ